MRDGPLDMRMDPTRGQSAAEWLQTADEADSAWVLNTDGEERFAKRIARPRVERNLEHPMTRTKELAEVVAAATPLKHKFKHTATRTFQAVRSWVNSELEEIDQALKSSLNVLAPGGRLSIISFHSRDDRLVKRCLRDDSRGPQVPAGFPLPDAQRKQLVLERDALDIEWRTLILEENALGDHSRVERIATEKLQLQNFDPSQEIIVVQK